MRTSTGSAPRSAATRRSNGRSAPPSPPGHRRSRAGRVGRSRQAAADGLVDAGAQPSRASGSATASPALRRGRARRRRASPGRSSITRLARSRMRSGSVSATTCAPFSCGVVARRELLLVDLGGGEAPEQVPVQRPVGRQRHVGHQLDPVGADLAHRGDELERGAFVVAHAHAPARAVRRGTRHARARGCRRRRCAPLRATTTRRAHRSPSRRAPARPSRRCAPTSPASLTAASPITTRRIVEWPTRNPAFTPRRPSIRSSHSPNVRHSHAGPASSASIDMPSTRAIIRMM